MSKTIDRSVYEDRLGRVTAYIYDHLDDEIDLQKLADVACMSPYHWHRVYHAMQGETVATTVKRLRLHRAAGYLAQTTLPIDEVAARSGYKNLQSFTRIFKATYGLPPAQYRKNGSHTKFQALDPERTEMMYEVEVRNLASMTAVTVPHQGSYMKVGQAFERLFGTLATHGLLGPDTKMVGIYLDDPSAVAEDALRSHAGVIMDPARADGSDLAAMEIPGGPHAVLHHQGPYADMQAAYDWLFGEWLPQSGHDTGDAPVFETYLNNPRDTPPTELLTEINLPLR